MLRELMGWSCSKLRLLRMGSAEMEERKNWVFASGKHINSFFIHVYGGSICVFHWENR
jgi:hypothetical protein